MAVIVLPPQRDHAVQSQDRPPLKSFWSDAWRSWVEQITRVVNTLSEALDELREEFDDLDDFVGDHLGSGSTLSLDAVDGVNEGSQINLSGADIFPDWYLDLFQGFMRAHSNDAGDTTFEVGNDGAGKCQLQADGSLRIEHGTAIPAGGAAGQGVKMSSVNNFGVFFGSGVPTLSAAKGSLYLRSDGSTTNDRIYVNTNGTTGWTAVTTAA